MQLNILCLAALLSGAAAERITVADARSSSLEHGNASGFVSRAQAVHGHANLQAVTVYSVQPEEDGTCKSVLEKLKRLASEEIKKGGDQTDAASFLGEVDEVSGEALLDEAEEVLDHADLKDALEQGEVITAHDDDILVECTTGQRTRLEENKATSDGHPIVQGDMVYSDEEEAEEALLEIERGEEGFGNRWPKGVVPYCFSSELPNKGRRAVMLAIAHIKQQIPCISFTDIGSGSTPDTCAKPGSAIVFTHENDGCWSYVGRISKTKAQPVNLAKGCQHMATALHEIMHALGFRHTQSRMDRDKYVKVIFDNIERGAEDQFLKSKKVDVVGDYDLLSIMHYDPYAFSKDRRSITIQGLEDPRTIKFMGQRDGLSQNDVNMAAAVYGCHGKGKPLVESNFRMKSLLQPVNPGPEGGFMKGKMKIWIKYAKNVPVRDTGKAPSSLIVIKHGSLFMETKQVVHNQNPEFDSVFVFDYNPSKEVIFKVADHSVGHLPKMLGEAAIPANSAEALEHCEDECGMRFENEPEMEVTICVSLCSPMVCGCQRR